MGKRKKLTKKKKEKIFEIIAGALAFIGHFLIISSLIIIGCFKNRILANKIMLIFVLYGWLIFMPLVFYILPRILLEDGTPHGKAKKVVKEKLKIISFGEIKKYFNSKLNERNIEVGNFKNNDYYCTFGIYNNKSYAIVEELIYLKNPTKKNISDYRKNSFDELSSYISFEKKYIKYARRYVRVLMIIVVDELNPNLEEEIKSDILQFGTYNRFPVFISLKNQEIFIPIQKSQLGIGEWRRIKKIFIENYKWLFENTIPEI